MLVDSVLALQFRKAVQDPSSEEAGNGIEGPFNPVLCLRLDLDGQHGPIRRFSPGRRRRFQLRHPPARQATPTGRQRRGPFGGRSAGGLSGSCTLTVQCQFPQPHWDEIEHIPFSQGGCFATEFQNCLLVPLAPIMAVACPCQANPDGAHRG